MISLLIDSSPHMAASISESSLLTISWTSPVPTKSPSGLSPWPLAVGSSVGRSSIARSVSSCAG